MTDRNTLPTDADAPPEEELRRLIEMLYFAYRDFTAGPDGELAGIGFGRAHHRIVYFVGRNPGITVGELFGLLRITKQSLARVLSQLVAEGYVVRRPGEADRRLRHLELTAKGVALEERLTETQRRFLADAVRRAGAGTTDGFRRMLRAMIGEVDRQRFPEETS